MKDVTKFMHNEQVTIILTFNKSASFPFKSNYLNALLKTFENYTFSASIIIHVFVSCIKGEIVILRYKNENIHYFEKSSFSEVVSNALSLTSDKRYY